MDEQITNKLIYCVVYPIINNNNNNLIIDPIQVIRYLPQELLLKIYTEYFRPHKYVQLYNFIIYKFRGNLNINQNYKPNYRKMFETYAIYFLHHSTSKLLSLQDDMFDLIVSNIKHNIVYIHEMLHGISIKHCLFIKLVIHTKKIITTS